MLNEDTISRIKEKAVRYPRKKSAILPALTEAYRQLGYVDDAVYKEISTVIGVPEVEVAEAASFYTLFPKAPRGKYLIQVCHNISCALLGADSLVEVSRGEAGYQQGGDDRGQYVYTNFGGVPRVVCDRPDDADQ